MIRRRARRRWWLIGAFLVVGVVIGWVTLQPPPGGPLQQPTPVNSLAFAVHVGVPFTFGLVTLRNPSGDTAVLDRLELVDATPGLELVDALVRRVGEAAGRTLVANSARWPPAELASASLHSLDGWRFAPSATSGHDLNVVLGLRVAAPGAFRFEALALDYHIGAARYRAVLSYRLRVCAPVPASESCREPSEPTR